MKYQKPELGLIASAIVAIQAGSKGDSQKSDMSLKPTIGAYEADE